MIWMETFSLPSAVGRPVALLVADGAGHEVRGLEIPVRSTVEARRRVAVFGAH